MRENIRKKMKFTGNGDWIMMNLIFGGIYEGLTSLFIDFEVLLTVL
jgi:hypothetical protein